MNVAEGSKRMQHAGRILLLIALSAVTLFLLILIGPEFLPGYMRQATFFQVARAFVGMVASLGGLSLLFGAALWIAGWIVEGFAQQVPEVER